MGGTEFFTMQMDYNHHGIPAVRSGAESADVQLNGSTPQ